MPMEGQSVKDLKDKWTLVTGASSGIGAEFASQLAQSGANVIMVARREERLSELADSLREKHGVVARVVAMDLLDPDAPTKLFNEVGDTPVDLLVNNAGFGDYGAFTQIDGQRAASMVQLNIQCLVQLTHIFLPGMIERKAGAIINVASTSAFQAVPYMSLYAATKAFVLHFSEGLWAETRKQGVTVQALCPGFTKTEFFAEAGLPENVPFGTTTVRQVVSDSLEALPKRRQYTVPGWVNYFVSLSNRLITRRMGAVNGAKIFSPRRLGSK